MFDTNRLNLTTLFKLKTLSLYRSKSIKTKFLISYSLFAMVLCATFFLIFYSAETQIEKSLVKNQLLQQLHLSVKEYGNQPVYDTKLGIILYQYPAAPANLQKLATPSVQNIEVVEHGRKHNIHFFKYTYQNQLYILSYIENANVYDPNYPVLTVFEDIEKIIYKALFGALLLSILLSFIFSYLSAKSIIDPILDLKNAVEADHQDLALLSHIPSEVGVLARAIDEKNKQLSEFLLREQLFTADVSHELRTPLTIIMGASEVLECQLDPHSPLREFTERINKTAAETSQMISALLLLSRAPEQLDTPLTSINPVVQSEVERLNYLIKYKPVVCTIESASLYSARIRPELLKMVLSNLIRNAFQYTEEGTVTVEIDQEKIAVSDTGVGIPEAKKHLLFKRFERFEPHHVDKSLNLLALSNNPSSQNLDGTGLGLSIVQRIVLHMGWRMVFAPNPAGGSMFSIYYR